VSQAVLVSEAITPRFVPVLGSVAVAAIEIVGLMADPGTYGKVCSAIKLRSIELTLPAVG
jgi:hypothetical protein